MRQSAIVLTAFFIGACCAAMPIQADDAALTSLRTRVEALEAESLKVHLALWGHGNDGPPTPDSFFTKAENGNLALERVNEMMARMNPLFGNGSANNAAMIACFNQTCP